MTQASPSDRFSASSADRARRIDQLLADYRQAAHYADVPTKALLGVVLTDLMQFCTREEIDFQAVLARAVEEGGTALARTPDGEPFLPARIKLSEEVSQKERETIEQMLRAHYYNRAATARALGISRVTLYNKIHKYQIDAPDLET